MSPVDTSDQRPQRPRIPALTASLIQAGALVPTLALTTLAARAGHPLPMLGVAMVQGALAALLTWALRVDPWWRAIQLGFPVALVGAYHLHLPPSLFLIASILFVLVFWSTFRTRVPYFPSGPTVWNALEDVLPPDRRIRFIDIGSGLGGLVIHLARRHPGYDLSGIELAPLPWLLSVLRARLTGSSALLVRGDYERLNFGDYDIVFAYLSPAAMSALWRKAQAELRPGALLISYEFDISARAPDRTIPTSPSRPELFVWQF